MTKKYDMCMIGLGPVGTISAACIARQGFNVIGVDIDPARVETFRQGRAPFTEPGIDTLIQEVQAADKFRVTLDFADAVKNSRIIMIAVGTPTPESGEPDLSFLDNVSRSIGNALKDSDNGTIIVVRSTVPPGTMRNRMAKLIESTSGKKAGTDFFVASNPEFLREGKAIEDFFTTGRVVIGADSDDVAGEIEALYRNVIGERIRTTIESAEFAKYVDNTWHALKVSFANEIGRVCKAFGGNPEQTTKIFLADHNLNISSYYLRPGFAFGGSCLPKDVRGLSYMASKLGVNIPVVKAILPSNEEQIEQGTKAVLATKATKIGVLGVAFKENVDDLRESPSLTVTMQLKNKGLSVLAHDPSYAPDTELALPKSTETLAMASLDTLAAHSQTLVLFHNSPVYREFAEQRATAGVKIVDLTTVTQLTTSDFRAFEEELAAAGVTLTTQTSQHKVA